MDCVERGQCSSEELSTLEDILDTELKICEILEIDLKQLKLQPPSFELKTLNFFKMILRKIYSKLLKTSNEKRPKIDMDNSQTFQSFQQKEAYQQIEDLLQKEQSKNRNMLKKQFQFKEYLNSVIEELNQQKSNQRKLKNLIQKLNQQIHQKDLEILHLKNQSKAFQRGIKDIFIEQKPPIKTKGSYNLSSFSNYNGYQFGKEDKLMYSSRQRQNSKTQMRKSKAVKQSELYALYNYHKKISESNKVSSHGDTIKKSSQQKQSDKKSPFKEINSYELSNKKPPHLRRKSEQFYRKTPSNKELRQQRRSKKKAQQIIDKIKIM